MTRRLLLSSLAVLALTAGCGGAGGDPDADPAAAVPARSPIYLEVDIDPEGDTEEHVRALSEKLAGTGNPGAVIIRELEEAAREDGGRLDFEKDIDPWLGNRVAVYVTNLNVQGDDSQAAVVATTEDPEKAREFLEAELARSDGSGEKPRVADRQHRDTDYKVDTADDQAVVVLDEYAIVGTEQAVKGAIDAKEGESLADADAFKDARDAVQDKSVGFAYLRPSALFASLGPQGAVAGSLVPGLGDAIGMGLDADSDEIRVETASIGVREKAPGPGEMLAELPGDAWFAVGTADLGGQIEGVLRQVSGLGALGGFDLEEALGQIREQTGLDVRDDLLSWMGDAGFFLRGTSIVYVNGGLIVRAKDEQRMQQVIPRLGAALRRLGGGMSVRPLRRSGVDRGITVRAAEDPAPVHVAAAGDRFIVAVDDAALDAALDREQPLSESTAFREAAGKLGGDVTPALFLEVAPVRRLVDQFGAMRGQEAEGGRRAVEHLTALIAGGQTDGDVERGRIVVGVSEQRRG